MAKMSFNKTVKYAGTTYLPNTAFEVDNKDVADLKKSGGTVEKASKKAADKEPDEDEE